MDDLPGEGCDVRLLDDVLSCVVSYVLWSRCNTNAGLCLCLPRTLSLRSGWPACHMYSVARWIDWQPSTACQCAYQTADIFSKRLSTWGLDYSYSLCVCDCLTFIYAPLQAINVTLPCLFIVLYIQTWYATPWYATTIYRSPGVWRCDAWTFGIEQWKYRDADDVIPSVSLHAIHC